MRFQTPQFIEVEDKIFGPLTAKQFVYVVGGAGLCIISYLFLPFYISIFVIPVVAAFAGALAFYQVNNRPFIYLLEASLRYITNARLYLWKRRDKKVERKASTPREATAFIPAIRESSLTNMSWNLTVDETAAGEDKASSTKI